jgi:hypothetical protein
MIPNLPTDEGCELGRWPRAPDRGMTRPEIEPPGTVRLRAAAAAAAIRAALADPVAAGERGTLHVDMARPRRGVWFKTWANLPGLFCDPARKTYTHALLPGWEYTVAEMRGEMIEDLERLAATGEQPTKATR